MPIFEYISIEPKISDPLIFRFRKDRGPFIRIVTRNRYWVMGFYDSEETQLRWKAQYNEREPGFVFEAFMLIRSDQSLAGKVNEYIAINNGQWDQIWDLPEDLQITIWRAFVKAESIRIEKPI